MLSVDEMINKILDAKRLEPTFIAKYDEIHCVFGLPDPIKDNIQTTFYCINTNTGNICNFIVEDFNAFFDAVNNRTIYRNGDRE